MKKNWETCKKNKIHKFQVLIIWILLLRDDFRFVLEKKSIK